MRSAYITSSGDPYVLLNCLHYYETVWQDEIDELWIALNTTMEKEIMGELIKRFPKKVKFIYTNHRMGYGKPINVLLEVSPEGKVLLLEDDTIIFKKGVVTQYFDLLDEYDLIGSPRMSCSAEVAERLKSELDLDYSGWGDKGPNFWPCFFWVKKRLLRETDRNFDPSDWGDTFCWASVQMRRIIRLDGNKLLEIPQYHSSPDDFQNKEQGLGIFDGECGYMHLGSLSSGIESYLLDENQTPLSDREAGIRAEHTKPIEQSKEMEKRLMWWWHCYDMGRGLLPREFEKTYHSSWKRAAKDFDVEEIMKWRKLYMEVINAG